MSDPYNNDVTYAKKWDTEENEKWQKKVEDRFFDKSICSPSCPAAWAKEVYELLSKFDDEFGIMWNTETIRAYRVQGKWYYLLTVGPFIEPLLALYHNMIGYRNSKSSWTKEYWSKASLSKKIFGALDRFAHSYSYGRRVFRVQVIAPIMNRIKKPKFVLSQVKEKYGRLEIYFQAPSYLEEYIEHEIAKTQVKLAMKGAYYPLETLFESYSSCNIANEFHPEDMYVRETKYGKEWARTTYRKAMKELGVDLTEMTKNSKFGKGKVDDDNEDEAESV